MRNRLVAFVLSVIACAVTARAATSEIVDGVAAIVNDKIITYSEVKEFVRPVVAQLRAQYSGDELVTQIRKAQMDALNTLIERTLIIQEFHKKGFSFPETAVDDEINHIISSDYGGDRTVFTRSLQEQNETLSQYRDIVKDRIIVQAMSNRKKQQQLVVSPYKMEQYYNEHLDDWKVGDQVKLRIIFIKKSDAATAAPADDSRRKLAEEILAKLESGESFESMAKVYSEGKEAKSGGDWGWVNKNELRSELNEIAFKLKPGQNSKVVDTKDGYYILHIEDVRVAHSKPLAEVRDEIEKILREQTRTKMQEEWVKQLRAKAYIHMF